jgi:phage/plasmid-like protein (TIGR03299 family)
MAHKIELPHDMVLSVEGTEWHGLATHVDAITEEVVKPALFDIIESPCFAQVDGVQINLNDHKMLIADHRQVRPDLAANEQLVPLHVPKDGYRVISNSEIWNLMSKALKDLDCKVTSVCTLERGKKFSISCDLGGSEKVINKDSFKSYLNFVTSHDGTMNMEAFDSTIRVVCMNTFQWSREEASDKMKIRHTKNADLALDGLAEVLEAVLQGRIKLQSVMEYLNDHKCDSNTALAMAAGYFCMTTNSVKLSSRSMNAASEIADLFSNGIGNNGRTLYDLANGATEYWTHGNGTGKQGKTTLVSRVYRSQFGQAADHKVRFIDSLANENTRQTMLEMGKDAVALALKD